MVDPTPLNDFRGRVAKSAVTQAPGVTVQEFTDAFEGHFFDMLGLELSDTDIKYEGSEIENDADLDHEANPEILHMAIADGCLTYATQKIAALDAHFTSNTDEQEALLLQNVNDFSKAGQTAFHRPLTRTELNDMLHRCLTKTSVELFKTNIFPSPVIER